MTSRVFSWIAVISLFAPLTTPLRVMAQEEKSQTTHQRHYLVKDLGTLGGGYSFGFAVNNLGVVFGAAATPKQTDFIAETAFVWDKDLKMINLGTLGGEACSGCSSAVEGAKSRWESIVTDPMKTSNGR